MRLAHQKRLNPKFVSGVSIGVGIALLIAIVVMTFRDNKLETIVKETAQREQEQHAAAAAAAAFHEVKQAHSLEEESHAEVQHNQEETHEEHHEESHEEPHEEPALHDEPPAEPERGSDTSMTSATDGKKARDCTSGCPLAKIMDFTCECSWFEFVRNSPTTVEEFYKLRAVVRAPDENIRNIDDWIPNACASEKYRGKIACHYIPRDARVFSHVLEEKGYKGFSVEIGVHTGLSSKAWMAHWTSGSTHYCVDPYLQYKVGVVDKQWVEQKVQDEIYEKTKAMLGGLFGSRVKMVRNLSVEASERFKDEKFDFIFIDARHDYDAVMEDCWAWFPKLRKNGIIGGHDFSYRPTGFAWFDFVASLADEGDRPVPMYIAQDTGPANVFIFAEDLPKSITPETIKHLSKAASEKKFGTSGTSLSPRAQVSSDCMSGCPPLTTTNFDCPCSWYEFVRKSPTTADEFYKVRNAVRAPDNNLRDLDPWIPLACADPKYSSSIDCHFIPRDARVFSKVLQERGYTGNSVEIGVHTGLSSKEWMRHWPSGTSHYCVDPYLQYKVGVVDKQWVEQDVQDKIFATTKKFLEGLFGSRVKMVRKLSTEAAVQFEDEYFDFIFIDARHDYDAVVEDCFAWFPKLKKKGIIGGHDFSYRPTGYAWLDFVKALAEGLNRRVPLYIVQDTGPGNVFVFEEDLPRTITPESIRALERQAKEWKYNRIH